MSLLAIRLKRIPNVLGIYGPNKDQFPARMSMLHPDAAAAFDAVIALTGQRLRVSDMYRTPAESLKAMQTKRGVQPPGYSAHNFGFAIDIDTDAMLAALKCTKAVLDVTMQSKGWYCHRKDSKRGMEDWHYNFLGDDSARWLASASATSTAGAVEAKVVAFYGAAFASDERGTQERLKALGHYAGAIDGAFGPGSQAALKAFQAAVQLPQTGVRDAKTLRTLAVSSATLDVAESTVSV
jgi:hypothetical protein